MPHFFQYLFSFHFNFFVFQWFPSISLCRWSYNFLVYTDISHAIGYLNFSLICLSSVLRDCFFIAALEKSKVIIFVRRCLPLNVPPVHMEHLSILFVSTIAYLGLYLDTKLCWANIFQSLGGTKLGGHPASLTNI